MVGPSTIRQMMVGCNICCCILSVIFYCRHKYIQPLEQKGMKESGLLQEGERPQIGKHNRIRLMQQNKKLMIEIQKLDVIISSIIEKNVTHDFQHLVEKQQLKQKYSHEQNLQMKEINRLKQDIKIIKASQAEHHYQEIKNQENQIVFLKRQYDRLATEKYTLAHKKSLKQEALQYHKPINQQASDTYDKYKKTKLQNGELKYKIHQLEREVNKYHKYKELSKTSAPRVHDNPDYEFMKIDNQIKNMKKEMGRIQEKWKPKIQSLDREYFTLKNILQEKETLAQQAEKQARALENKTNAFRDQQAVASHRQRITSVPISPTKRKQMQDLLQLLTAKNKEQREKKTDLKNKKEKGKKTKDKVQVVSAKDLPVISEKKQEKGQESHVLEQSVAQRKAQSERLSQAPSKPTKMMENVGVGTSFYYEDD